MAGNNHDVIENAVGVRFAVVPVGDILGELDSASVAHGYEAGRVEVLLWCQTEIGALIRRTEAADRFADTRALKEFYRLVQDNLKGVQDGSSESAELLAASLAEPVTRSSEGEVIPGA